MGTGKRFAIIANQAFALLNFRSQLLTDIAARGVVVSALAPDFSPEDGARLRMMGILPVDYSLSRTGLNPMRDVADLARLRRILIGLNLDGVLSVAGKSAIYGTLAASLASVPRRYMMITGLGYAFSGTDESLKRKVANLASRTLFRLAIDRTDGVFMQNPDDVDEFQTHRILSPGDVLGVYGTGINLAEWQTAAPHVEPVTFSLVARMLRDKGVKEFVEAARRVKTRYPETVFRLLGGLDSNPAAISQADLVRWVHEGIVEWPGRVDVKPWLATTSVFVLPSYREGVPRSTQEAMSMGRPVITTDVPGCRETVADGRNGFLVPPRDAIALADAMEKFVKNPAIIATMGMESRRLAEQRFDATKINARIIAAMGL